MKTKELIDKVAYALFIEEELDAETVLEDLDGWDSIGRLGIIALFNELFDRKVEASQLKSCKTIQDIINLVKEELED